MGTRKGGLRRGKLSHVGGSRARVGLASCSLAASEAKTQITLMDHQPEHDSLVRRKTIGHIIFYDGASGNYDHDLQYMSHLTANECRRSAFSRRLNLLRRLG
jgi:hypothetical protein